MNILLWTLQILTALLYAASGVMKVFMFDKINKDVRPFDALPREAWMVMGIVELICVVGLIVPSALNWKPLLTVAAAVVSLVFIFVHIKSREIPPMVMSGVLELILAFIAYGRFFLRPIL